MLYESSDHDHRFHAERFFQHHSTGNFHRYGQSTGTGAGVCRFRSVRRRTGTDLLESDRRCFGVLEWFSLANDRWGGKRMHGERSSRNDTSEQRFRSLPISDRDKREYGYPDVDWLQHVQLCLHSARSRLRSRRRLSGGGSSQFHWIGMGNVLQCHDAYGVLKSIFLFASRTRSSLRRWHIQLSTGGRHLGRSKRQRYGLRSDDWLYSEGHERYGSQRQFCLR